MKHLIFAGGALAILAGCKKDRPHEPEPAVDPEGPPITPGPTSADRLVKLVRERTPAGMRIAAFALRYVRADGTMDPTYGELAATVEAPPPPPPPDDPSRPIGAPSPTQDPMQLTQSRSCRTLTWRHREGFKSETPMMCMPSFGEPVVTLHCTALELWQRALADGAPDNALARLELDPVYRSEPATWTFSIVDAPRGISFSRTYPDDCPPIAEAPAR